MLFERYCEMPFEIQHCFRVPWVSGADRTRTCAHVIDFYTPIRIDANIDILRECMG